MCDVMKVCKDQSGDCEVTDSYTERKSPQYSRESFFEFKRLSADFIHVFP
jgi:hypothetical protein